MIRVANLMKRYGRTVAVKDISFSIKKGEIVGFLGPNGAGKTTTMRVLSCFIPPTRGTATIAGLDVVRDSMEIRRRVGYMPETVPLYPEMRVREYLDFRAGLRGLAGRKRRERVRETLELCGLKDVSRFVIGRLSKGYRQRIGLADCLVHDPELLILDEPTLSLDPNQVRNVRKLIKNLAERHTVLLSTHILSEVEMLCNRVLIMDRGRIVASDERENLLGLLKGNVRLVAEIKGPVDQVLAESQRVSGVLEVSVKTSGDWHRLVLECEKNSDVCSDLFSAVARNGWTMRELRAEKQRNLEDVFVAVTGHGEEQS